MGKIKRMFQQENSPPFQGWGEMRREVISPAGTAERLGNPDLSPLRLRGLPCSLGRLSPAINVCMCLAVTYSRPTFVANFVGIFVELAVLRQSIRQSFRQRCVRRW